MVQIKIKSHQWIVDEKGRIIMGKGRMEILEQIEETGSINQAAKAMKMSYKGVWSKIKSTEKHFGIGIVHTDKREGTRLSSAGRELLAKYRRLRKICEASDDRIFKDIFG